MRSYNKLRTRMYELEYNQSDLARVTGHAQSTISEWFSGKQDIRRGDVPKIAAALGIAPEELGEYFFPEMYAKEKPSGGKLLRIAR